jgi:hypothetical protein
MGRREHLAFYSRDDPDSFIGRRLGFCGVTNERVLACRQVAVRLAPDLRRRLDAAARKLSRPGLELKRFAERDISESYESRPYAAAPGRTGKTTSRGKAGA